MATRNVLNKTRVLQNRTQGTINQYQKGYHSPHRTYSAAMLSDSLDIVCKPFTKMAYAGDYPEAFFDNFAHGKLFYS